MRPVLVLFLLIAGTLFISSAQIPMPVTHLDQDHGWAGPHPSQLVSYNVKVTSSSTQGAWGQPATITASVGGSHGMIVTGISAIPDSPSPNPGGRIFQVRMVENTVATTGQWEFKDSLSRWGISSIPTPAHTPAQFADLRTGLPITKGVALTLQVNSQSRSVNLVVTITGYTW